MRIDNPSARPIGGAGRASAPDRGKRSDVPGGGGGAADSVALSSLSASVLILAGDSPQRQQRVEGLELEVRERRYREDARATSAAMVREALGEARAA